VGTLRVGNKQELKTKRCKNDALENPKRGMELSSFYRNRQAKKTRWRPRSPPSTNPETRYVILSNHIHAHAVNRHVVVVQSAIAFVTRHVTYPVPSASACVTPRVVYSVILMCFLMYSHVMIYPLMQVQLRIFGRVLLRVCIPTLAFPPTKSS
jgi:hypothetical protein